MRVIAASHGVGCLYCAFTLSVAPGCLGSEDSHAATWMTRARLWTAANLFCEFLDL